VFECGAREPHYGAIFAPRLTDFYLWTVPKPDGLHFGGAFRPGRGVAACFDEAVDVARGAGVPLGRELVRHAAPLLRPSGPSQLRLCGDRAVLLGEAAGLISPSSGEGVSYALRSAAAMSDALAGGLTGAVDRYRLAVAPVALDVCLRMGKSAVIHGALPRRFIRASGAGAVRTVRTQVAQPAGIAPSRPNPAC
jgi:2-polyprenyl-6-methoxyphenol hydroxylase-like FAD-dependent oxidoreductase